MVLLFLLSFCLQFSLSFTSPHNSSCPCLPTQSYERDVLSNFYKLASETGWLNSTGWLEPSAPHCTWYGISCDGQGFVSEIRLPRNRLTGEITPLLAQLKNLQILDLSYNSLEGMAGPQFSGLTKLMVVNLSTNNIQMFEMEEASSSLQILDLSLNLLLMVQDDLGEKLQHLKELNLSKNCLMMMPDSMGLMQDLEVLDLSLNVFDMLPDPMFTELKNLKRLYCTYCSVGMLPDSGISGLQSLEVFEFSWNKLMMLPMDFDGFGSLQVLNLEYNELEMDFNVLMNMTSLRELKLAGNMLEGVDVSYLLPTLEVLTVWCSELMPSSLNRSKLTDLNLRHMSSSNSSESMPMRSSGDDMMMNSSSPGMMDGMFSFPDLPMSIEMVMIEVDGMTQNWTLMMMMEEPPMFPNLTGFWLRSADETIEFPKWIIDSAPHLESIQIANFFGPIPAELADLDHLTELILQNGTVRSTIPTELGLLSGLTTLEIEDYPLLTGTLPTELSNLHSLKTLVLSGTNISGEVPPNLDLESIDGFCLLGQREQSQLTGICSKDQILLREDRCGLDCPKQTIEGSWVIEPSEQSIYLQQHNPQQEVSTYLNVSFSSFEIQFSSQQYFFKVSGTIGNVSQITSSSRDPTTIQYYVVFYFDQKLFSFQQSSLSRGFNHKCLVTYFTEQGEIDISNLTCPFSTDLQFQSISDCPFIEAIIQVDYNSETLELPLNYLLFTPCANSTSNVSSETRSSSVAVLESREMTLMKKGWECDVMVRSSIQCSTVCGDGIVSYGEQCDYANLTEQSRCSSNCLWLPTNSQSKSSLVIILPVVLVGSLLIIILVLGFLWNDKRKRKSLLISEEELECVELIGEGHFGKVYKGIWRGTTEVAIKQMKMTADDQHLKDFQEEARFLTKLPPHPNIVQFLGLCFCSNSQIKDMPESSTTNPYENEKNTRLSIVQGTKMIQIVTEFLAEGNLVSFMQAKFRESPGPEKFQEDYLMMVDLGEGIAAGMDHLHKNSIVHRDLAARNVLVQMSTQPTKNRSQSPRLKIVPKITDFGLSGKGKGIKMVPVRWSAPEVLLDSSNFAQASDVWSYGIVLYELSVYCSILPYSELATNKDVREYVVGGGQVANDSILTTGSYNSLMRSCFWSPAGLRPNFSQLFKGFAEEREFQILEEEEARKHPARRENSKRMIVHDRVVPEPTHLAAITNYSQVFKGNHNGTLKSLSPDDNQSRGTLKSVFPESKASVVEIYDFEPTEVGYEQNQI